MRADLSDAHNHLHDERLAAHLPELLERLPSLGIRRCVVNGTCEDDWPQVAALARAHPDLVLPSFGLHPWKVSRRGSDWLACLRAFLAEFPQAGIGECGLDRWIKDHDLPEQQKVFRAQLALAAEENRPLSIHCLQAWGPLHDLLREHPRPERGFLLHSYGGSAEMVPQFAALGAYFSFSGYFLEERKSATRDAFRHVPPDRLLLESDAPDMPPPEELRQPPRVAPDGKPLNHPGNLPGIAARLAEVLELDSADLAGRLARNFRRFFEAPRELANKR